jgi:hypothetical protein
LADDIIGGEDANGRKRHREEPLPDDGKMPQSPLADLSPKKQRISGTEVVRGPQPKRRELGRTSSSDFAEAAMEISAPDRAHHRGSSSRDLGDAPEGTMGDAEVRTIRPRRNKTKTEGDLFFEELAKKKPSFPIGPATKTHPHFELDGGGEMTRARGEPSTEGTNSAKVVLDVTEVAGVPVDIWNANDTTPRARAAK